MHCTLMLNHIFFIKFDAQVYVLNFRNQYNRCHTNFLDSTDPFTDTRPNPAFHWNKCVNIFLDRNSWRMKVFNVKYVMTKFHIGKGFFRLLSQIIRQIFKFFSLGQVCSSRNVLWRSILPRNLPPGGTHITQRRRYSGIFDRSNFRIGALRSRVSSSRRGVREPRSIPARFSLSHCSSLG